MPGDSAGGRGGSPAAWWDPTTSDPRSGCRRTGAMARTDATRSATSDGGSSSRTRGNGADQHRCRSEPRPPGGGGAGLRVARGSGSRAPLSSRRSTPGPATSTPARSRSIAPPSRDSGRDTFTGDYWETDIDLTFELDLWGRLRRATEAARGELLASEENRRAVLLTLVADVARTYFDLLGLDQGLEIARRTLQTRQASLELQRHRLERGLSTQLDVERAAGDAAVAAATVPDLERRIAQTENGLSVLLGRNPGPVTRGTPLDGQRLPPEVPAGLPSALLERRPDIRQAEQTLVAANARIGVAKAEYFPQILLTGLFGVESVSLSDLFTAGSRFWAVGPTMTVPLFTAGRIQNSVKATEARQQQAARSICRRSSKPSGRPRMRWSSTARCGSTASSASASLRRPAGPSRWPLSATRGGSPPARRPRRSAAALQRGTGATSNARDQLTAVVQVYKALGGGWQSHPAAGPSASR